CRVSLKVDHPRYARWDRRQPARSGTHDLLIPLLPGGSIQGRVLSEQGAPVAGVRVRCHGGWSHRPPATTDPEGRFRFDQLAEETYVLFVEGQDVALELAADPQVCPLPEGGEARCPDLRMERLPVAEVTGKVLEAVTGQPIPDVSISAVRQFEAPGGRGAPVTGPLAYTDAEGRYRLSLRPGKWWVR